jgi:hypothetical protein
MTTTNQSQGNKIKQFILTPRYIWPNSVFSIWPPPSLHGSNVMFPSPWGYQVHYLLCEEIKYARSPYFVSEPSVLFIKISKINWSSLVGEAKLSHTKLIPKPKSESVNAKRYWGWFSSLTISFLWMENRSRKGKWLAAGQPCHWFLVRIRVWGMGVLAHTCNPSYWDSISRRIEAQASLAKLVQNPIWKIS